MKKYETPAIELTALSANDVITVSGFTYKSGNGDGDSVNWGDFDF